MCDISTSFLKAKYINPVIFYPFILTKNQKNSVAGFAIMELQYGVKIASIYTSVLFSVPPIPTGSRDTIVIKPHRTLRESISGFVKFNFISVNHIH